MDFDAFEARAWQDWERIPESFKQGVDGLTVARRAQPHPSAPDVFTLGECLTESYPSDFGGPDTIRSAVVLYWGSFRALAELDDEFDWEHEIWETLTHELRHHLESLASDDALEDVDYAADENFRRWQGDDFDTYFFQRGEPVAGEQAPALEELHARTYRVETDWFIEATWRGVAPPERLTLRWHGLRWRVEVPRAPGDVAFLRMLDGFEPPETDAPVGTVEVVLLRRYGFWQGLRRMFGGGTREVTEHDVSVVPLPR